MILKGGLVMDKIVQCIEKTLGHKVDIIRTQYRKVEFDIFERAFHIDIGIDCLSYHINMGDKMMQNKIMEYLDLLLNK